MSKLTITVNFAWSPSSQKKLMMPSQSWCESNINESSLTEGMDFSYHVRINESVEEGLLFEALAYIECKKKIYYFSLVCTCRKASINKFQVFVDVQNGTLRFRGEQFTIDVLVSSNSCYHPLLSYDNCPQNHLIHD